MVTHLRYCEERYRSAAECLAGITSYLHRGWELSEVSPFGRGHFVATFRFEEQAHGAATWAW